MVDTSPQLPENVVLTAEVDVKFLHRIAIASQLGDERLPRLADLAPRCCDVASTGLRAATASLNSDQVSIWDAMMNSTASPNVTSLPIDSSVMKTSNSSSILLES